MRALVAGAELGERILVDRLLGFDEMLAWLRDKRWQSLGFGGIVYVALLVPLLNLLIMPAAVAGATLFWVREGGKGEIGNPVRR